MTCANLESPGVCVLLKTIGVVHISESVCESCKSQWDGKPPNSTDDNKTLQRFAEHSRQQERKPVPYKPAARGECFHLGPVLDRLGCNCQQKWISECRNAAAGNGGKTRLTACRECDHFEEA